MEDPDFLNYFINEEIYLIEKEDSTSEKSTITNNQYLIVTPEPLSEEDKNFLYKIFASVNVNQEMLKISEGDYQPQEHKMTFFFGTTPDGFKGDLYQKTTDGDCTLLAADTLAEIAGDNGKKRALWTVLKSCFG